MTSEPSKTPVQTWSELRDAQYQIAQLRVAMRAAPDRIAILRQALHPKDAWQQRTAFEYLKVFTNDVPELVDQLLGLSTSIGWLPEVISVFREADSQLDQHLVASSALRLLSDYEEGDAPLILNLLSASGMWHALETVTKSLLQSEDKEIVDAAREYSDEYGWAFPSRR